MSRPFRSDKHVERNMRQLMIALAAAGAAATAWCGSASAQSAGVEVYVGPRAYDSYYDYPTYRYYRSEPRVYGYTQRSEPLDAEVDMDRPTGPGGCGTYRYWNGHTCVDARYK
jgi:hypothetical protein